MSVYMFPFSDLAQYNTFGYECVSCVKVLSFVLFKYGETTIMMTDRGIVVTNTVAYSFTASMENSFCYLYVNVSLISITN